MEPGTRSEKDSASERCLPCTGFTYQDQKAQVEHALNERTTIAHSIHFYLFINHKFTCKPVTICFPGTHIERAHSPSQDRVCGQCTAGKDFTSQKDQPLCTAVTTCPAGFEQLRGPTFVPAFLFLFRCTLFNLSLLLSFLFFLSFFLFSFFLSFFLFFFSFFLLLLLFFFY